MTFSARRTQGGTTRQRDKRFRSAGRVAVAATPASAIWVINSFQLAVILSLLPLASLDDVYGHRRIFCWGLWLYKRASAGCAMATTLPQLAAGRVQQGFGGAGIISVNGALVRFIFPRSQVGRGTGYNVLAVATSSAAGPPVAAAIIAVASWPWLFAIQVPFGIVSRDRPEPGGVQRPHEISASGTTVERLTEKTQDHSHLMSHRPVRQALPGTAVRSASGLTTPGVCPIRSTRPRLAPALSGDTKTQQYDKAIIVYRACSVYLQAGSNGSLKTGKR